jgi:hypothetical protein
MKGQDAEVNYKTTSQPHESRMKTKLAVPLAKAASTLTPNKSEHIKIGIGVLIIGMLISANSTAYAAVLDFEHINGPVPVEGMAISNQFQPYYGITFEKSNGQYPSLAKVGLPNAAFTRDSGASDKMAPADAATVGQFFLTVSPDGSGGAASDFITLIFDAAVSNVSGLVLDLDGSESVFIRAYTNINGAGTFTSVTIASGDPGTGDGIATHWQISHLTKDIQRVELHGQGWKVGWDLLSSDYIPTNAPTPQIGIRMYPGIIIQGVVGRPYRIDYANSLDITPGSTNWHPMATNFLPVTPYLFIDTNSASSPERFYRTLLLP